jgi:hypothetical protein
VPTDSENEPMVESAELSRFLLADSVPANGEIAPCRGRCNNSPVGGLIAVSLSRVDGCRGRSGGPVWAANRI